MSLDATQADGTTATTFDPDYKTSSITLSAGNLQTNSPGYYSGVAAKHPGLTSVAHSSPRKNHNKRAVYIEFDVGPTYGSYAEFGFFEKDSYATPADAFCASRLAEGGHLFGTLPSGVDFGAILDRTLPAS